MHKKMMNNVLHLRIFPYGNFQIVVKLANVRTILAEALTASARLAKLKIYTYKLLNGLKKKNSFFGRSNLGVSNNITLPSTESLILLVIKM